MTTMKLTTSFILSSQAIARQIGDEMVILDLASDTYFGLDPVGARIWQLMGGGKTLAEICETMLAEYEVALEDLERDTLALAAELAAQKLIVAK